MNRKAKIYVSGILAGVLEELADDQGFCFFYEPAYLGNPVSLTMPVSQKEYRFKYFPPFFEGLLPEGFMLEGLLQSRKIDRRDFFSQLLAVGADTVGAVTIEAMP